MENHALHELVDPRIEDSYDMYELHIMAKTSFMCIQRNPELRPSMGEVTDLYFHFYASAEICLSRKFEISHFHLHNLVESYDWLALEMLKYNFLREKRYVVMGWSHYFLNRKCVYKLVKTWGCLFVSFFGVGFVRFRGRQYDII